MTSSGEIVTFVACPNQLPAATSIGAIDTSLDDKRTGITKVLSNRYPTTFLEQLLIEHSDSCRISPVDKGDDRLMSAMVAQAGKSRP